MIKPVDIQASEPEYIKMSDMKPLDIGVTRETSRTVMRTASRSKFEVMDLSIPSPGSCWGRDCGMLVKLLKSGTKITLEVQ